MSVFKANKNYLTIAQSAMSNAKIIEEQQKDIDFGRELLSNIRQYRLQQAALEMREQSASTGVTSSSFQTANQYLQQQVSQPYQQAVYDYARDEEIAEYQRQAQSALEKYKKQAKTARTAGYITSAVLAVAGGFFGAVAAAGAAGGMGAIGGAAVGGAVGTGVGMGVGAVAGADRNYYGGAIEGGITGTTIAVTASAGGLFSGGVSEAGGGTAITKVGGQVITESFESAVTSSLSAKQLLAAGTIISTIGGMMKDINGYKVQVPVSTVYTGKDYSQYVQSFRGFM